MFFGSEHATNLPARSSRLSAATTDPPSNLKTLPVRLCHTHLAFSIRSSFRMEAGDSRPPHFKLVKLEFDRLAFLQLMDVDIIECVETEENLVSRLSQDKATASSWQDFCNSSKHCFFFKAVKL